MPSLTFQFVQGHDAVSHLIMWKNDAEVSHVNVVQGDGQLFGALLDGGVRARPADYDTWPVQIRVTIPVTDAQFGDFWTYCNTMRGTPYDKLGIVGIATGRNIDDPQYVFCSKLFAEALDHRAHVLRIAKDPGKIDPDTLRLLLTAMPGATEERIAV